MGDFIADPIGECLSKDCGVWFGLIECWHLLVESESLVPGELNGELV